MARPAFAVALLLFSGLLWASFQVAGNEPEGGSNSPTTSASSSNGNNTTATNTTTPANATSTSAANATSNATAGTSESTQRTDSAEAGGTTTYTYYKTFSPGYTSGYTYVHTNTYPIYPPPPTQWPTRPNENYTYELVGQTVYQDVWIYSAREVKIRNSHIHGNLGIGWSSNVVLEDVTVEGQIMIDQSVGVSAVRVHARSFVGFSFTEQFRFTSSDVGAHLGCFKCAHGQISDVQVRGQVFVVDSFDVVQLRVRAEGRMDLREPTFTRPTENPVVVLNVTNSSLEFVHRKEARADGAVDVRLAVDARGGTAHLAYPSQRDPGRSRVELRGDFEKLVEFEDRDGNGAYDLGDHVVREFVVEDLPIGQIQQQRTRDGGWIGRIEYDLGGRGRLILIFASRDDDADRTKIDIEIDGYRYAAPRSQLAVQIRLASASAWDLRESDDEHRLYFFGEGAASYFGWKPTASLDGAESRVSARVLEEHRASSGDREVVLLLGYGRAAHIVHDPSIGILEAGLSELLSPRVGDVLVYGTTLVAVVAVLWALGYSRRGAP